MLCHSIARHFGARILIKNLSKICRMHKVLPGTTHISIGNFPRMAYTSTTIYHTLAQHEKFFLKELDNFFLRNKMNLNIKAIYLSEIFFALALSTINEFSYFPFFFIWKICYSLLNKMYVH